MRRSLGTMILAAASGCFQPAFNDGAVECGANALCPPGHACAIDNRCYRAGSGPRGDGQAGGGDLDNGDLVGGDLSAITGDARAGDSFVRPVLTVGPTYPALPNWNDYVRNEAPALPSHKKPGTPCDGTETQGWRDCIHAGEQRKVDVSVLTSCQGLTLSDNLGAFEWFCEDEGGTGPVTFYATRLAQGMGLGDLVDATGFVDNRVTLQRNANPLATSPLEVWGWTNPVVAAPDNSLIAAAELPAAGTIYVIDGVRRSNGYNINADGVALVVLPGGALEQGSAMLPNVTRNTGELAISGDTALVAVGGQKFVWVEGTYGDPSLSSQYGLYLVDTIFSRVHNFTVIDANADGIRLYDSSYNRFTNIEIRDGGDEGLSVVARDNTAPVYGSNHNSFWNVAVSNHNDEGIRLFWSDFNEFRHVRVAETTINGIDLRSAQYNLFADTTVYNVDYGAMMNNGNGIEVGGTSNSAMFWRVPVGNVFSDVLIAATRADGYHGRNDADRITVTHLTVFNAGDDGFAPDESRLLTAANLLALQNSASGFQLTAGSIEGIFAELYVAYNSGSAIRLHNATMSPFRDFQFLGDLWVGGNAGDDCHVGTVAITNPGLVDVTCTASGAEGSTTPMSWLGVAGAMFHPGRDVSGAIVGRVMSDDSEAPDDAGGSANHGAITDWARTESRFRVWGRDVAAFPDRSNAGVCASGPCRIWDVRTLASDSQLHQVNGAFTPGGNCPASVHGDRAVTDRVERPYAAHLNAVEGASGNGNLVCEAGETCNNRFLTNAQEILDDDIGDDDGLCESNESCVYSPNIGAYQGEGPFTADCTFQDGLVSNVLLRAYSVTGL